MRNLLLILALLVLSGCTTNPLLKPSESLYKYIIPEYERYVKNDDKLTAEQKNRRKGACLDYGKLLRDVRKVEGN